MFFIVLEINQQYLKHDTLTDVITFNYSEERRIIGDIIISIDQVRINAKKYDISQKEELYRVMVHGLLHLIGYDDKNKQEQKIMKKKEFFYLKNI